MKPVPHPLRPAKPCAAQCSQLDRRQRAALVSALSPIVAVWLVNGWYLPILAAIDIRLLWGADVAQWVVLPAALIWMMGAVASLPPRCYGLGRPSLQLVELALKSSAVFVTAGLAFAISRHLALRMWGPDDISFQVAPHFPGDWWGALVRVYASISAGLVESIFFIGMPWLLYAGSSEKPSPHRFTVAVSAVFALAHWEQGGAVATGAFFSHLALCACYLRWRTLWPVAGGHALVDLVSLG